MLECLYATSYQSNVSTILNQKYILFYRGSYSKKSKSKS